MNSIKIDSLYSVEVDPYNWKLIRKETVGTNKETGKPIVSNSVKYYPNLKSCLVKYVDENLKNSNTIKELIDNLDKLEIKIGKLCKGIKKKDNEILFDR